MLVACVIAPSVANAPRATLQVENLGDERRGFSASLAVLGAR